MIASPSKLYPWSVIVSFSTAPIFEDHANILAPVPCDTLASVFAFTVVDVAPVIFSAVAKTPVFALDLLITSLLLVVSSLKTTPVASDVAPVTVSPTW